MFGKLKLLLSIAILLTNIASAILTFSIVRLAKKRWAAAAMSSANCIIVGIFFGIIFLLQLPEIPPAELALYESYGFKSPVPVGTLFIVFGLLLVNFMEIVTKVLGAPDQMPAHGHSHVMVQMTSGTDSVNPICENDDAEDPEDPEAPHPTQPSLYKYMMFTALMSLHSLTEGIPLGYKKSSEEVYAFFYPLFLHKILEAVSVACAGIQEKSRYALIGSAVHASMTPIGTFFGYMLVSMESSLATDLIVLAFMGASTGVITYITFVEVLAPEMKEKSIPATLKLILIASGFSITAIIASVITSLEEAN